MDRDASRGLTVSQPQCPSALQRRRAQLGPRTCTLEVVAPPLALRAKRQPSQHPTMIHPVSGRGVRGVRGVGALHQKLFAIRRSPLAWTNGAEASTFLTAWLFSGPHSRCRPIAASTQDDAAMAWASVSIMGSSFAGGLVLCWTRCIGQSILNPCALVCLFRSRALPRGGQKSRPRIQ